ncbi:MAG: UvrD-helicase domain-containing protein [Caldimicrobium sp.]|nr:UvrD-helicase domain-containing protein [Caldimicrobium sp.]MCX7872821.1 UvrD-helicase domain-containing protein [Caldimicrobium sp.]MDW8093600.1 UvrD-helicase domain-containing protein [Caldimicrobium sp.]
MKLDFLSDLNPAQREAVESVEGPLLVIAGAGSGKTKTLVCRMAYLVAQGVSPEGILLLTFTRRAAREMINRAGSLLKGNVDQITGGTFHSICNLLLRQYGHLLGYERNFTLLDRGDMEDLLNLIKNSLGFTDQKKRFPTKQTLAGIYSKYINQVKPLSEILAKDYPQFLEFLPEIEKLFVEYQNYKKEYQLMDYDDLLVNWLTILKNFPTVREEVGRRFEFIMVDEYQDTNYIQGEIVKYMGETHQNVMVVGDDSQSIYGFRGANFKNILDFPKLFRGTKIIKLEQNYRSTQAILDLANVIIANSKWKYTKTLFTEKKKGEKPYLLRAKDETESSQFIADKVLELREKGLKLSQIAVLFRSAYHSYDLEVELTKRGIPFIKYGGLKLLESAHIKDLLSFLKIILNPRDYISWNRVLLLLEGIGPRTVEKILNLLKREPNHSGFSKIILLSPSQELKRFLSLYQELTHNLETPTSLLGQIWEFYEPIFQRIYYEDYTKRLRDIEGLFSLSEKYLTLEEFLTDLILEPFEITELEDKVLDEDPLILSTIHSAKGLEWHTVFIISLIEGRFPSLYSLHNEEELEEERRLFYVAVTRAREQLFLIAPLTVYIPGEGKGIAKPSRFLKEIPPYLYSEITLKNQFSKEETPLRSEHILNSTLYKVGDLVKHPHFGEGEVLEVLGEKIKVNFINKGPTLLHLKYTQLEKLL